MIIYLPACPEMGGACRHLLIKFQLRRIVFNIFHAVDERDPVVHALWQRDSLRMLVGWAKAYQGICFGLVRTTGGLINKMCLPMLLGPFCCCADMTISPQARATSVRSLPFDFPIGCPGGITLYAEWVLIG